MQFRFDTTKPEEEEVRRAELHTEQCRLLSRELQSLYKRIAQQLNMPIPSARTHAKKLIEALDYDICNSVANVKNTYAYQHKQAENKQKVIDDARKAIEEEKAKAEYVGKAVQYLLDNGKVFGTDFNLVNAVTEANSHRYNTIIAEKMAEGGYHSFGGDDDCENCSGWDGESHRCECGNRRVSWECDGDFLRMWVYAQAY